MRKKKDGGDEEGRETVRTKNEYIGNEDVIRPIRPCPSLTFRFSGSSVRPA